MRQPPWKRLGYTSRKALIIRWSTIVAITVGVSLLAKACDWPGTQW